MVIHRHIGGLENDFSCVYNVHFIHRHIGGLETENYRHEVAYAIHRHIGGLEIRWSVQFFHTRIHRHIGGLEKILLWHIVSCQDSPPHRRLRKQSIVKKS